MLHLKHPVILASNSRARATMLENVQIKFEKIPAKIDEDKILKTMAVDNKSADQIAGELARQKALNISAEYADTYVIGSDQVLECEGALFQKANNEEQAKAKLKTLRGKTHHLISSVAVAKNNNIIWEHTDTAKLTMHNFDDDFLQTYLDHAKDDITNCVGAYAFENQGAWLFEKIDANYFTILGMPLMPLLSFLRTKENR